MGMEIKVDYDVLNSGLATVSSALYEKNIDDKFAIEVTGDTVRLLAFPQGITCRVDLEAVVEGNESEKTVLIQTNLADLTKALASYKGLSRTRVSQVVLKDTQARLLVEIHEESASEDFDIKDQVGHYQLSKVQEIAARDQSRIDVEFPEEGGDQPIETHPAGVLAYYLSALIPTLDSKTGTGTKSSIMFDNKYAYTLTTRMGALLKNERVLRDEANEIILQEDGTPETATTFNILAGYSLTVQQSQFLLPLTAANEGIVEISRVDTGKMLYIAFRVDGVEAFISVSRAVQDYGKQIKPLDRENGDYVRVDRRYLRDVLRRLQSSSDDCVISWNAAEGVIRVKSAEFDQEVPVVDFRGDLEDLKVVVTPGTLAKLMIGDDAVAMSEVLIYPQGFAKMVKLYLTDEKGHWVGFFNASKDRG